ncbi:zinc finger domain-containing protein [Kitasatospora cathayae]|uniref:DNA-binding phage zinc finger domain-containing protein n=1 Tax=Kitasatospora cathayae TaxID=3004092 RepID=A0ABY7Q9R3_9ACTN|nr:hypothetical protein [Kitasatospora sp. HUAS 3-15]WBP89488.1 hypothetical protein O1G21_29055 [Kitasatospora sp. HUAS 3-15]
MTPSQVAELLTMASAFDRRTVGKTDVMAWHLVLRDVDFEQAQTAVAAHYADTRDWIMPSDIRHRVRKQREQAAADIQGPGLPAEIPDADPDDVPAYLAALRAQRTRAALGESMRPRPVAELLAGVGREVPTPEDAAVTRVRSALDVRCPYCHAPAKRPCKSPLGRRLGQLHPSRFDAVKAAQAQQGAA